MGHASADLTTDFLLEAPAEATHQFAGTLFVALFAALFWTGLLAAVGAVVGHPPGTLLLMTLGIAIAGFLAAVVHMLFGRVVAQPALPRSEGTLRASILSTA